MNLSIISQTFTTQDYIGTKDEQNVLLIYWLIITLEFSLTPRGIIGPNLAPHLISQYHIAMIFERFQGGPQSGLHDVKRH